MTEDRSRHCLGSPFEITTIGLFLLLLVRASTKYKNSTASLGRPYPSFLQLVTQKEQRRQENEKGLEMEHAIPSLSKTAMEKQDSALKTAFSTYSKEPELPK